MTIITYVLTIMITRPLNWQLFQSADKVVIEPVHDKTNNLCFRPCRHEPACTVTEAGKKLDITG